MKKIFNIIEILSDLKDLEKKIYLDSPEVFVDFADRISDNNLDEMVLFFATKYDYLSIVKFILDNDIINLNNPSKNQEYATIKEHILAAAVQFNAKDIYDYILNFDSSNKNKEESNPEDELETFLKTMGEKLSDLCGQVDLGGAYYGGQSEQPKKEEKAKSTPNKTDKTETVKKSEETKKESTLTENTDTKENTTINGYEPKFICPNCSCNIFESGYSTVEKVNYKYSKDGKGLIVTSKEQENVVNCSKCGYTIEQLNPAFLENICTVQNCKKCGKDLTAAGIVTKMKTEYDNESNSFITSKKSFHCAECDTELTDYQVNYFKL